MRIQCIILKTFREFLSYRLLWFPEGINWPINRDPFKALKYQMRIFMGLYSLYYIGQYGLIWDFTLVYIV